MTAARAAAILLLAAGAGLAAERYELANPHLDELSGLAVSRGDPALLWGHNDTGGGPVLFRIGLQGEDLGASRLDELGAGDWEDIAAFEDARGPALLVADVGDNFRIRSHSTLYALRDAGREREPSLLWRLDFRYPDGARDCEAVAVDPVGREILLVTKRDSPPRLYRLPLPERPPKEPLTAEFLGTISPLPDPTLGERLKAPLASWHMYAPTALDISRDGATAVLVTPSQAYVYRHAPGTSWATAFREPAAVLQLPKFDQIEAAAISADGRELFVGTEGHPGWLARVPLPTP